MNKKRLLLLLGTGLLCLTSCGRVRYEPKDYILQMNYKDDFRILQLTDTHIGDKDNTKIHYDFLDLTINEAHPDLIVITGDVFTFASKHTAKEFVKFMDDHNIPWTLTFGNHDEQCFFSIDWLTNLLNNYGHNCLFKDLQNDDVQGNANFAINLMKDNKAFEQVIMMDSNRYYFGSYFGYDYFKQDQIDWYERLVNYTTEQNGGVVDSLMFYHIPLPEVRDAWAAAEENPALVIKPEGTPQGGEQREEPCNPDYNSGFFDKIKALKSTKGMYFGHDHVNDYLVKYEVEPGYDIHFGYGIKATDRVYSDEDLLGGRVITIGNDHSLSYQDYYHTYAEVM